METLAPQAVSVSNLEIAAHPRHRFQKVLLSGINFDLEKGSFVGVIGASGCGKSTLISALAGQVQPRAGRILFGGHPIYHIREQYPLAVGYLPQFGAFHGELTVNENLQVAVALRLPGSVSRAVRENWVRHIIELSRLQDFLHQPYSTLSGGQMRRMALAEELIGDPAFLLLDELTSGLDAFSDREMMHWLRDLAHVHGKTVILVTHAAYHLDTCDAILFLHQGRQIQYGPLTEIFTAHGVESVADLFELYQSGNPDFPSLVPQPEWPIPVQKLKTARPPGGWKQFPVLLHRHMRLFWRDRAQLFLHLALILTFPALIAVFAVKGLPQVSELTLQLQSNIVETLADQLLYLKEAFHAASLVSGLAMFQVILLTLIGANNGAREIAKEKSVLVKELRAGLSSAAYVGTKFVHLVFLCLLQSLWMAWFVKTMCGFPGSLLAQFGILFATTLAMSTVCLAISASSPSPERASLLAIYLVGFQLPLSGAALSLPDWLSTLCRPLIDAYWGWSGYLKTLEYTRHYDIVQESTKTFIAPYGTCLVVLGLHVLVGLVLAWWFVSRSKNLMILHCGILWLLGIGTSFAGMPEKISLPTPPDLQRADLYFLKTSPQPTGLLVLCPGCNGDGGEWIENPIWQTFARDHHLDLVGISFASEVPLLKSGRGYYYPRLGSGQLLLDGIDQVYHHDLPLLLFGFSGGAHFVSGFEEWKPQRVLGWCAYSAEWWDEPVIRESSPPGLVACGEDDERLGASLIYFKQGRALGKPWAWLCAPKTGHSIYPPAEDFIRDYFAAVLDSRDSTASGQWVDIDSKTPAEQDVLKNEPSVTGYLPQARLLAEWQGIHQP